MERVVASDEAPHRTASERYPEPPPGGRFTGFRTDRDDDDEALGGGLRGGGRLGALLTWGRLDRAGGRTLALGLGRAFAGGRAVRAGALVLALGLEGLLVCVRDPLTGARVDVVGLVTGGLIRVPLVPPAVDGRLGLAVGLL